MAVPSEALFFSIFKTVCFALEFLLQSPDLLANIWTLDNAPTKEEEFVQAKRLRARLIELYRHKAGYDHERRRRTVENLAHLRVL